MQHLFERRQDCRHAGDFQSEHQRGKTDGSKRKRASAGGWGGNGKGHFFSLSWFRPRR